MKKENVFGAKFAILGLQAYTYELRAAIDMFGEYISADVWPLTDRFFGTFDGCVPAKEVRFKDSTKPLMASRSESYAV